MKRFVESIGKLFGTKEADGLVRMFETEYSQEYRMAVRNGVCVDNSYVKNFLATRR